MIRPCIPRGTRRLQCPGDPHVRRAPDVIAVGLPTHEKDAPVRYHDTPVIRPGIPCCPGRLQRPGRSLIGGAPDIIQRTRAVVAPMRTILPSGRTLLLWASRASHGGVGCCVQVTPLSTDRQTSFSGFQPSPSPPMRMMLPSGNTTLVCRIRPGHSACSVCRRPGEALVCRAIHIVEQRSRGPPGPAPHEDDAAIGQHDAGMAASDTQHASIPFILRPGNALVDRAPDVHAGSSTGIPSHQNDTAVGQSSAVVFSPARPAGVLRLTGPGTGRIGLVPKSPCPPCWRAGGGVREVDCQRRNAGRRAGRERGDGGPSRGHAREQGDAEEAEWNTRRVYDDAHRLLIALGGRAISFCNRVRLCRECSSMHRRAGRRAPPGIKGSRYRRAGRRQRDRPGRCRRRRHRSRPEPTGLCRRPARPGAGDAAHPGPSLRTFSKSYNQLSMINANRNLPQQRGE